MSKFPKKLGQLRAKQIAKPAAATPRIFPRPGLLSDIHKRRQAGVKTNIERMVAQEDWREGWNAAQERAIALNRKPFAGIEDGDE